MALKQDGTHYCKWIRTQNGITKNYRLHELEIVARDGRIFTVKGDQLPEAFISTTDDKVKGQNVAQILLNPQACRPPQPVWKESTPPPTFRDIVAMTVGVLLFTGFTAFLDAILRLF